VLTAAALAAGIGPPAGLVLPSPWLDLTCSSATYGTRTQTDALFS